MKATSPERNDNRIIIHFDYDCFYAAVFERENPTLRSLPLAVQQKQIIVTCNYEARRRGLYKLQLVSEAKEKCPDVIILLGEDLTRFRDASKDNYHFLKSHIWGSRIEKLGFDEVFMDVTDMVEYNSSLLNQNDLTASFFHLDRADPTVGFLYDASSIAGSTFPANVPYGDFSDSREPCDLWSRLRLGSHLAQHIRHLLEEHKGFTSTVGISTSKLISKLVGNVNKPRGQTTLVPPYLPDHHGKSHVQQFIDSHDIGEIPGIGFKISQKIRGHVLGRLAAYEAGLVYGGTKENIKVGDVRLYNDMGPSLLGKILDGPGFPKDLADKIWGLINGVDNSDVALGRVWPQQISIEDSYLRLDEPTEVRKELKSLAISLLKRMRQDLTSCMESDPQETHFTELNFSPENRVPKLSLHWIALPRTIRLSTRPRPPLQSDGTRSRTFTRISKSGPMPNFIFNLCSSLDELSEKLVEETLLQLFWKLHPERSDWNLSLVNICATNIVSTASDSKDSAGRDILRMFKRQDEVLKGWKIEEIDTQMSTYQRNAQSLTANHIERSEDVMKNSLHTKFSQKFEDASKTIPDINQSSWDSEGDEIEMGELCKICGSTMPSFAMAAHVRFHDLDHGEEDKLTARDR